ncbi:MAG: heme exporter protein CcmB [Bacteroidota bacterium]|nr:heme exporter protein CcmB [Bacteroidota bacterium]MDE2834291.1 heme exporter protein CcmB [Bacteroidota bacterium]MDE2957894.1 heme exporter protein CcmB [Bacteroidota bacterium]
MTAWLNGTLAVLQKDLLLELRSRYALNTLGVFVLSTLLLVMLAAGQAAPSARLHAGLLWIVILFAGALGLGRSFVAEQEGGTAFLLRLHARPSVVYAGKLCFGILLMLTINAATSLAFIVLLGLEVAAPGLFAVSLVLGTLGLVGATTLLSAIIARTRRSGPLLPMLLFPLLVPLLLSAVRATEYSLAAPPFTGGPWANSLESLVAMTSYAGVVITASVLLFDYVWND